MCDFPSWYEKRDEEGKKKAIWCTDSLLDEHSIAYVDGVGHHAIKKVWKVKGEHCEGFPCPKEMVADIKAGKMVKMMEAGGYKSVSLNQNGELHSVDDEPAVIEVDGEKQWFKNGKQHRDGGKPAVIWTNGEKQWFKNGKLHRDGDNPAVIWVDGTKFWFKNGKGHRDEDLPAVMWADGEKHWYKNGKLHRDGDKPAVIWANGKKYWYKNGKLHRIETS